VMKRVGAASAEKQRETDDGDEGCSHPSSIDAWRVFSNE
jgi:hypothetical protein